MKPKFQELPNERFVPSGGTDQRATPLAQSADRSRVVPRFDEEFVVRYLTVPRGLLFGTILARIGYWNNADITTISKYVQGLTLRHVATAVTLFVAVLPLAIAVVLIGQIGKRTGVLPHWMSVTAWIIAVLLFLGWSVGLLFPYALWSIALKLTWKNLAPDETPS